MSADDTTELADLFRLHTMHVAGRDDVKDLLISRLHPRLIAYMEAHHWERDVDLTTDAATDALMTYLAYPERVVAADGARLVAFLIRASWRDVLNSSQKARRRLARERRYGIAVGLEAQEWAQRLVQLCEGHLSQHEDLSQERPGMFLAFCEACPPVDQEILKLMAADERRTAVFAAAMGLGGRPMSEQRSAVKRAKDRLKYVLKANGLEEFVRGALLD